MKLYFIDLVNRIPGIGDVAALYRQEYQKDYDGDEADAACELLYMDPPRDYLYFGTEKACREILEFLEWTPQRNYPGNTIMS